MENYMIGKLQQFGIGLINTYEKTTPTLITK